MHMPSDPSDRWLDWCTDAYGWIIALLAVGVAAAASWNQPDFSLLAFFAVTAVLWFVLFLVLLIPYFFGACIIAVIIDCVDYVRRRRRPEPEAGRRSTRSTGSCAWNDATRNGKPPKAEPRRFQTAETQADRARFDLVRNQDCLEPGVAALGAAMRPLLSTLRARMVEPMHRTVAIHDVDDAIARQGDNLGSALSKFAAAVDTLGDILSNDGEGGESRIHHNAGRLGVHLDDLLDGYDEVRRWDARGSDAHAVDLLEGSYRHILTDILDWLEELVEAIADPVAAAKLRGLPTSGAVKLNLSLAITDPPQLPELHRWVRRNGHHAAEPASGRSESGRDFWDTVGAVVVGCAIGDWMFGDDE